MYHKVKLRKEQGKSERFDSCDRPSNLTQIQSESIESPIFGLCDLEIWQMTLQNNREHLMLPSLCVSFHSHLWIQMRIIVQKYSNRSQIGYFSARVTLKFDVPSKTNRAPFHCPFKLCALFRSHMCIQTQVTVWRCSIRVKIVDYSAHVAWN